MLMDGGVLSAKPRDGDGAEGIEDHYVIALFSFLCLWRRAEPGKDYLLAATVLAVGTNITVFPLPLLISNHAIQLVLAGVVPCLTLALVYFRVPPRSSGEGNFQRA
jgi:hypothetical protein